MKKRNGFWLPTLLVVAALLLVSCGSSAGGGDGGNNEMQSMGHGGTSGEETTRQKTTGEGMAGMDHSSMGHGSMGSGGMAQELVMEDGRYSDRAFIDAMVPHHRGAVEMAEVALENAEHRRIRELAENIVRTQQAEIRELRSIKREEYGTADVPMEMSAEKMEAMGMTDPEKLAQHRPFDKAFIDAMIPHHQSAIEMAGVALEESDNPQIRKIAESIVNAQEREIAQMRDWRQEWYPEG